MSNIKERLKNNKPNNRIYTSKKMIFAIILPILCVIIIFIGLMIGVLFKTNAMIKQASSQSTPSLAYTQADTATPVPKPTVEPHPTPATPTTEKATTDEEALDVEEESTSTVSTYGKIGRTEDAGRSYYDSLYFFGGVEIASLALYTGIEDDHVITTDKGVTTQGALEDRVFNIDKNYYTGPEALKYYKPRAVIIQFGQNGGTYMSVTTFTRYYRELIEEIQDELPNTKIVIVSVYPVTHEFVMAERNIERDEDIGIYDNDKIEEMNAALLELSRDLGVYYLAANGSINLGDLQNAPLDPKYAADIDSMLLNRDGNERIEDYIRKHQIPNY